MDNITNPGATGGTFAINLCRLGLPRYPGRQLVPNWDATLCLTHDNLVTWA